jgi:hypothetical protein
MQGPTLHHSIKYRYCIIQYHPAPLEISRHDHQPPTDKFEASGMEASGTCRNHLVATGTVYKHHAPQAPLYQSYYNIYIYIYVYKMYSSNRVIKLYVY